MTLDMETIDKIKSFVYSKPRSINEIALMLGKNWRTANRYIEEISSKTGTIQTRVFRKGSRGSLKIVFWNNSDKIYSTDIQEKIFAQIEKGIEKKDFSPIEIFQYIEPSKRDGYFEEIVKDYQYNVETLIPLIEKAKEEILMFVGTSSWINLKYKDKRLLDYAINAARRGVIFKIITEVSILDKNNLRNIFGMNIRLGKEQFMIRHDITPLRAYIFDGKIAKLSEVKVPKGKPGETDKSLGLYYAIYDEEWVEWLRQLFWKKFHMAIPAKQRLDAIEQLHKYKNG